MLNIEAILESCISIARRGGDFSLDNLNSSRRCTSTNKFSFKYEINDITILSRSIVTTVDLELQELFLREIGKEWGYGFSVFAEEDTELKQQFAKNAEYCWVIDPLDATFNYCCGNDKLWKELTQKFGEQNIKSFYHPMPQNYAHVIGLKNRHEFLASVIYFPLRDLFYTAIKWKGACRNNLPFAPKNGAEIIRVSSSIYKAVQSKDKTVIKSSGLAAAMMDTAECNNAGFISDNCVIYDAGPCSLIIQETGGAVCDNNGKPIYFNKENIGYVVAGKSLESNLRIAAKVNNLMKKEKD